MLGWDHLFGSTKKIVLVRDFRDKFVSTIRYFKQIDPCDGLDPDDQLIKFLKEEFIPGCRYFAHTVSLYRQESLIVRYEDLIRTPDQALRGIVDYLELNEDFGTDLTSLLRYDAGHGTAGSVDKTMGCHLSLPKPLSEILTSNLATELLQFGYS